jgi:hypothetical protein
MENVVFKCYSEGDKNDDMLFVNASNIKKIKPLNNDKFKKLLIEYYDDEFCVNSSCICDYVEPMEII